MSDKHDQEAELIESADPESAADSADATEGEQTQEDLDLDDSQESKKEVAQEQREKKIASLQAKIDRGEISIDSLADSDKWASKHLTKAEAKEPIIDEEALEKVISKREERKQFLAEKERLADADLSSDQIKKLNEKYKLYRSKGMSELDALTEAKEVAQIDLEEVQVSRKRSAMKLPKPGGKSIAKDYDQLYRDLPYSEAAKVIPADKLDEILRKSARS